MRFLLHTYTNDFREEGTGEILLTSLAEEAANDTDNNGELDDPESLIWDLAFEEAGSFEVPF